MPKVPAAPQPAYVPRAALRRSRPAYPAFRPRAHASALATRITPRDLWLLEMLHEHRVLTSHHITALWNVSQRVTNRRLRLLHHLHALDSFRPLTRRGSAPEHFTLGRAGAELLAARYCTEVTALAWRKDTATRTAFSPTLEHDLAVNTLLTTLAAEHHRTQDRHLTVWLSARSAARLWGDWTRPDAYAHFRHSSATLPFFLEYDTGSETLGRVEAKLAGYAALAASTATRTPLLIHTSSAAREIHLRRRLTETAHRENLLLATTHTGLPAEDPTGSWLPLTPTTPLRYSLPALANLWPNLTPALTDQPHPEASSAAGRHEGTLALRPVPPCHPPRPSLPRREQNPRQRPGRHGAAPARRNHRGPHRPLPHRPHGRGIRPAQPLRPRRHPHPAAGPLPARSPRMPRPALDRPGRHRKGRDRPRPPPHHDL